MADFNMSRKNVYTGRTKIDGRTFQIEFWDDDLGLPWVSISEIVTREIKKNWFSRKTVATEVEVCVDYGWTEQNRLDWALGRIAKHLREEQNKIKELQEIEAFCKIKS